MPDVSTCRYDGVAGSAFFTRRLAPLAASSAIAVALVAPGTALGQPSVEPSASGVVEIQRHGECLSEAERGRIRSMLDRNISQLRAEGRLPPSSPETTALDWPLAAVGLANPGYHAVSNFVDLDSAYPDELLDYSCGERSYDTTGGYNHSGIDYYLWPFWWYKMDHDQVAAVAAAPGTIVGKDDGRPDRSCSFGPGGWNAVYVMHADGSEAWYGHLQNGSLTTKMVGSPVAAGEFLGFIGSSGSSTNPHLHLEIRNSSDAVVEPHTGACQTDPSWWSSQRPYYDSRINLLATHSEPPEFPPCPQQEVPHFSTSFAPAATVHVAAYFRDLRANEVTDLKMIMPDGTPWQEWQHSITTPDHLSGAYWVWSWNMPPSPLGTWTFEATYKGVTYSHEFVMGSQIFGDGFEWANTLAWSGASP